MPCVLVRVRSGHLGAVVAVGHDPTSLPAQEPCTVAMIEGSQLVPIQPGRLSMIEEGGELNVWKWDRSGGWCLSVVSVFQG